MHETIDFYNIRIAHQRKYIVDLQMRRKELSVERFEEINNSAMGVLKNLLVQRHELINSSKQERISQPYSPIYNN